MDQADVPSTFPRSAWSRFTNVKAHSLKWMARRAEPPTWARFGRGRTYETLGQPAEQ